MIGEIPRHGAKSAMHGTTQFHLWHFLRVIVIESARTSTWLCATSLFRCSLDAAFRCRFVAISHSVED